MAKPGQAHDQTMDEILASIRQMISENNSPAARLRASVLRKAAEPPTVSNVSPLFAAPEELKEAEPPPVDPTEVAEMIEDEAASEAGNVIDLAMAQAMEEAREVVKATAPGREEGIAAVETVLAETIATRAAADEEAPEPMIYSEPIVPGPPTPRAAAQPIAELRSAQPLMSPQSDAAVAGAFNQLASSMLARSGRTLDELAEDLLRPMLRNWLDDNLPPLVERLVREEIERVSRGRR